MPESRAPDDRLLVLDVPRAWPSIGFRSFCLDDMHRIDGTFLFYLHMEGVPTDNSKGRKLGVKWAAGGLNGRDCSDDMAEVAVAVDDADDLDGVDGARVGVRVGLVED